MSSHSVSCVSVAEAEYAAASYTSREMEFIRNVCTELGFTLRGKLVLCVDNSAAIQIAERHGVTARTTHFRATLHRLRAEVLREALLFCKVAGKDFQYADGMTKVLSKVEFLAWRPHLLR